MSSSSKRQASAGKPPIQEREKDSILAKEEEFRRLNAELEARTANLVSEAERVLKDQERLLSAKPTFLDNVDAEELARQLDNEHISGMAGPGGSLAGSSANLRKSRTSSATNIQRLTAGGLNLNGSIFRAVNEHVCTGGSKAKVAEEALRLDDFEDVKLMLNDRLERAEKSDGQSAAGSESVRRAGSSSQRGEGNMIDDTVQQLGVEAQLRFLKAKSRVLQEELEKQTVEIQKRDEKVRNLEKRVKESEEETTRLQRVGAAQLTQLEKWRKQFEETRERADRAEAENTATRKELEQLQRERKANSSAHSNVEVRLNRALEEIEEQRATIAKLKNSQKDANESDRKAIEELRIENRKLEKHKEELIAGFKKQQKLIDILKRQKMHLEAARMLNFSEEEFLKALEWDHH